MIYLVFWTSILLHEISHIIIGYIFKNKIKKFKILPIGFFIEFDDCCDNDFCKKIIILLAGPISNFFISIIFGNLNLKFCNEICFINIVLGLFNLLPIYPLDGEKILEIILIKIYRYKKGRKYSFYISKILLCFMTFLYSLLILKMKNVSILMVILFLWYKNFEKENQIKIEKNAYKVIEKTLY